MHIRDLLIWGLCCFICLPLSSQKSAPDFAYINLDNSTETLWDQRGQVIYMSFWASWCKPCLRNFKKYESIRTQLQDRGVLLLNVNIDDSRDLWETTLDAQNILGTNVWASDFEQIQDDYEIFNIPQYEIVDKSGILVYLPDDPDRSILEAFNTWLSED